MRAAQGPGREDVADRIQQRPDHKGHHPARIAAKDDPLLAGDGQQRREVRGRGAARQPAALRTPYHHQSLSPLPVSEMKTSSRVGWAMLTFLMVALRPTRSITAGSTARLSVVWRVTDQAPPSSS